MGWGNKAHALSSYIQNEPLKFSFANQIWNLNRYHKPLHEMSTRESIYLSVVYPEPIASHVFHICHIMSGERSILRIQMHHNSIEQVKWRSVARSSHKWNHIQHVRESDALVYFPVSSFLKKQQPWFDIPTSNAKITII